MFGRQTERINEVDQRAAELARQRKELSSIGAERTRLAAVAQAASAAQQRAHTALGSIMKDPMRFASIPDDELTAAKKELVASARAEQEAAAEQAAHENEHGDLLARGKQLRHEEELYLQAKIKSDDRADAAEIVRLGTELAAVLARREQRLQNAYRRWPQAENLDGRTIERGGGLVDFGFAPGIFGVADTGVGLKSIWRDGVLQGIHAAFPDVQLPPGDAAIVSERANKNPRWFPRQVAWDVYPARRLGS